MAYDLNWSVLGAPVDVGAAVQAGYQTGRARRLQGMQDSAFSRLAADPTDREGLALLVGSGHADQAHQMREWGREDRGRDWARAAMGGGAAPAFPTGAAATPSAFAPAPAAGPSAPVPAAPAAPVAAPGAPAASPGQLNPQIMRQWFLEDPQGARQFQSAWASLDDAQRATETRRFAAAVPILAELGRVPLAQRSAAITAQQPYLTQHGWTAEEVQHFAADPSDTNIRMLMRMGVPIAEQHTFFAPLSDAPGTVYRDPFTQDVTAANPTPPRDETYYDQHGNQVIRTVPGTPAIGPGARLFGTVAPADMPGGLPQPGSVVNGFRYHGPAPTGPQDPALNDRSNWTAVEGGAGQPQAPGTFPRQDGGAFDFSIHPTRR